MENCINKLKMIHAELHSFFPDIPSIQMRINHVVTELERLRDYEKIPEEPNNPDNIPAISE